MGGILTRWKMKHSTVEVLEGIEQDIQRLQSNKDRNRALQKKFVGSLLIYSILIYIVAAVLLYFYYWPDTWKYRLIYSAPLLLFPLIIWTLKRFLHWYFVKRITQNDAALEELKEKKKQILDDVMEKETYKKAKEILEKYDPEQLKGLESNNSKTPAPSRAPQGQELRSRSQGVISQTSALSQQLLPGMTPHIQQRVISPDQPTPASGAIPRRLIQPTPQINGQRQGYGLPPGPPLPRPIPLRDRSTVDKLVEYLVGDGPQNRYALICTRCMSHNGMALKEEFEYISYRCCYCYAFNESRKKRPFAPKIETLSSPESESGKEDNSADNTEGSECEGAISRSRSNSREIELLQTAIMTHDNTKKTD